LGDVAGVVANTSLPVRWVLSQKFESLGKIGDNDLQVRLVHGMDER